MDQWLWVKQLGCTPPPFPGDSQQTGPADGAGDKRLHGPAKQRGEKK